MRLPSKAGNSAEGFTLIELMVGGLLGVLILVLVAGITVSSTATEGLVRNVSIATSAGQSLTNSIERGVRNAASSAGTTKTVQVLPDGSPTVLADANDQLVTALVVGSGATITTSCAAWYYSASTKSIRYRTWASGAVIPPTVAQLSSWRLLSAGVTPVTGTTIFTQLNSNSISFAFNEDAGNDPAIPFQSTVTSRTAMAGNTACFR